MRTLRLSRLRRILVLALAALAGAADLCAAGGGEKGGFSSEVIWQIISLVLLIVLLSRFVKKPLAAFFQEAVDTRSFESGRK